MNPTFDTEVWENVIVAGGVVLLAVLLFWLIMVLLDDRKSICENTKAQMQNTELLRLWLLAFDSARKSGAVLPVIDAPEHPNDLLK